jgi:hypothetical protein
MNRLVARNVEGKSPRGQSSKTLGKIKVGKRIPEEKIEGILATIFKTDIIFNLAGFEKETSENNSRHLFFQKNRNRRFGNHC